MMAKVTMQDIADAVGVSRITVWKVFNNQEGVSDSLRTQIISKAVELGYSKAIPDAAESRPGNSKTVSVIVSRPESSHFWMNIIHRIAKEMSKQNIDLLYTYVPSSCPSGYVLPASLTNGTVQGCIILNVYDMKLIRMINDLPLPKVFLDTITDMPLEEIRGDLFLLEGVNTIHRLTDSIIKKGRTKIGFIGDICYARTNADRFEGFRLAMEDHHLTINPDFCFTDHLGIYTYEDDLRSFLRSMKALPEVFICVSDYVAHFVELYLNEHGVSIPRDIAITGYDGSLEYTNVSDMLTTVNVETSLLGKRLSNQLLFRIDNPSPAREVTYITSEIVYKNSTDF